ncbi:MULTISPECIES: PadR family transcriptional regulator [unclassified Actinomadura]|uniref:PadR family transcriptional regulator n=1 Tax=unclassified Actinomadura TaxID=2626254 RepID=UPI001F35262B|nr:PadR family transcriptional regulator [Actinomadura sp. K4S16]
MPKSMQEPTFLILTALADGPQHGYGIMSDVEQISDGRTRLRAGTLYAALDRLQAEELIAPDREEVVDGRLRRYYRLTEDGAAALAAEVEALQQRTRIAARRLAAFPSLRGGTTPAFGGLR